jgi:hypothetical protein
VAEENSKAADELLATGQFLVDVGHDLIPSEGLEKGSPPLRADETMGGTRPPHQDNGSSQASIVGAPFQGGDDDQLTVNSTIPRLELGQTGRNAFQALQTSRVRKVAAMFELPK